MSIHYQSVNGLCFSAFQQLILCTEKKHLCFVSNDASERCLVVFQDLSEQLRPEWLWCLGQV